MVHQTTKSEGFGVIVQKEDNAIQRMNCYQVNKGKENLSTRKRFTQWIELSILQTNCAGQKSSEAQWHCIIGTKTQTSGVQFCTRGSEFFFVPYS